MSSQSNEHDGTIAGRIRSHLLGSHVGEQAVAWGVVAFLAVYFVTPALTTSSIVDPIVGMEWMTDAIVFGAIITTGATIGAVALAYRGRGVVPAIILVFGPLAALAVRTLEVSIVGIPVAEQLGVAVLGAIALGITAYIVGRTIAMISGSSE